MTADILGSDNLVAIYIPNGTDEVWNPGEMRSRSVGAVKLLPMPKGKKMEDYPRYDWDGKTVRWPIEPILHLIEPRLRSGQFCGGLRR